jgi:hypothetical protein
VEQVIPRGVFVGLGRSFHEKSRFWSEAKPKRSIVAGVLLNWRQTTDEVLIASVIRLNPAIRDRVKSGHREWPKT